MRVSGASTQASLELPVCGSASGPGLHVRRAVMIACVCVNVCSSVCVNFDFECLVCQVMESVEVKAADGSADEHDRLMALMA